MPYRLFDIDEAANHLHLRRADLDSLVKNQEIPFERRGGRIVFRLRDLELWASQRVLHLRDRQLAEYHRKSTVAVRDLLAHEAIFPELTPPELIDAAMPSKTKASVLRALVELADKSGRLLDPKALLESLEAREALGSSALPGGLALPHPKQHQPYVFESSFVALGRPVQEIHFGAPDGRPTDLFFLVCCQEDRLHLHVLARLCLMAETTTMLDQLRQASDAAAMHAILLAAEQQVLAGKQPPGD